MKTSVNRQTVDLSAFPDLVVIYLGMQVRTLAAIKTLLGIGPQIGKAGSSRPEGLLHFETNIMFSLFPPHLMMRWYWRDFESMERWARSGPHRRWWQDFLRDSGGTGFWHEMYSMRGGMEAIYDDVTKPIDFWPSPHRRLRGVPCFLRAIDSAVPVRFLNPTVWQSGTSTKPIVRRTVEVLHGVDPEKPHFVATVPRPQALRASVAGGSPGRGLAMSAVGTPPLQQ